jgi:hypothetical protein
MLDEWAFVIYHYNGDSETDSSYYCAMFFRVVSSFDKATISVEVFVGARISFADQLALSQLT